MDSQNGYLSPDKVIASSLTEDDYEISGKGKIRIRSMTRDEMYSLRSKATNKKTDELDKRLYERLVVVTCVIVPELDINQVAEWQKNSSAGGELQGITKAIMTLSKFDEGADKSDVPDDGDDS